MKFLNAIFLITLFAFAACGGESQPSETTTDKKDMAMEEEVEDDMASSMEEKDEMEGEEKTPMLTTAASSDPNMNYNDDNVFLSGYDVVAYQMDEKAMLGSQDISHEYQEMMFYFASEEHKEEFAKNPEKYMPAAGGYCAFAMAEMARKVPVDPTVFTVENGKTYLFYVGPSPENPDVSINTKEIWQGWSKEDKEMKLEKMNENYQGMM